MSSFAIDVESGDVVLPGNGGTGRSKRIPSTQGMQPQRSNAESARQTRLLPNTPNPFNPSTTIEFAVGLDATTKLEIFDARGAVVTTLVDAFLQPGVYRVEWDASSYPSGLYYYRLTSGMWSRTGSMILEK